VLALAFTLREQLMKFDITKELFYDFDDQLNEQGNKAEKG